MLILSLQIEDPFILKALTELFLQSDIEVQEIPEKCEAVLGWAPPTNSDLPFADLSKLTPPFRIMDLLSLVHNLPYNQTLSFSHFCLNIRDRNLTNLKNKQTYRLTGKECQLLRFFYTKKSEKISRDTLLKNIWNYHPDVSTHTLETHIYRLRQKLEENPAHPKLLLNCKEGYLFDLTPTEEVTEV